MADLTAARRRELKPSQFALPEKNGYPDDTPGRARNALSRVAQFGTPSEKKRVRAKVARDYPGIAQSKPAAKEKKTGNSRNSTGNSSSNGRISRELSRRLEARDKR